VALSQKEKRQEILGELPASAAVRTNYVRYATVSRVCRSARARDRSSRVPLFAKRLLFSTANWQSAHRAADDIFEVTSGMHIVPILFCRAARFSLTCAAILNSICSKPLDPADSGRRRPEIPRLYGAAAPQPSTSNGRSSGVGSCFRRFVRSGRGLELGTATIPTGPDDLKRHLVQSPLRASSRAKIVRSDGLTKMSRLLSV
jgi:hypothetical protein